MLGVFGKQVSAVGLGKLSPGTLAGQGGSTEPWAPLVSALEDKATQKEGHRAVVQSLLGTKENSVIGNWLECWMITLQ